MKLSVVGYPRIGTLRELTVARAAYFNHTIPHTAKNNKATK